MEGLSKILKKKVQLSGVELTSPVSTSKRKSEAEIFNEMPGKIKGYDCKLCNNKGIFYLMQGDELVSRECKCMKIRYTMDRIEASGLKSLFEKYTFENYELHKEGQTEKQAKIRKELYDLCRDFESDTGGRSLLLAGQAGVGKTHLCTAICSSLINKGLEVRYMQWKADTAALKAIANMPDYAQKLEKLKSVDVLYIDDLFWTNEGQKPTAGDINIAFDVINYRYINSDKLITLISTNKEFMELMQIDETVASRIYEMCGRKYVKIIKKDSSLNYRFL